MLELNIGELLEKNHAYASVMHWHGIDAFSFLNFTLGEICRLKNIDENALRLEMLKREDKQETNHLLLRGYSPGRLCNYLISNHHNYAQRLLPVIEHHIQQTQLQLHQAYPQLHLLANIFTTFKEDFLKHIAYENNKVFPYIKKLEDLSIGFNNKFWLVLKDFSMEDFIQKHHHDDDEMHNIRKLLKNYKVDENDSIAYKVLMNELLAFENDLKEHSLIEEEILVPMALRMEQKLFKKANDLVRLN